MMKLLQDLKTHLRKLFMLPIIGMWLTPLRRLIGYKFCGIITAVIIVAWFFLFIAKKGRTKTADELSSSGISRVQEELNEIEKKLKHAITVVRESRIGQKGPKQSTAFGDAAPYILPWYMIIGKKGCGKTTLLMESGLLINSVLSGGKITDVTVRRGIQINPTLNCDCFLAEEAVILDTTGRYFLSDEELNKEDKEEWLGFLKLLKKYRPQKPIDGILLAVDVSILLSTDGDRIKEESKKTRVCIDEVIEQLGIRCPIYLVFTKCDSLYGFAQFFEGLEDDKRNQIWGYTVSVNEQRRVEDVFEEACEQLEQPLNAFRMMILAKDTTNPQNRREIVVFPLQFTTAYKEKLTLFVSTLFQTNPLHKANIPEPMLRGFYFSSGAQKPKDEPIDLVIKRLDKAEEFDFDTLRLPSAPKETKGYFIKDIFTKVIIPDKDLDKPPVSGWTRILRVAWFVVPIIVFTALVTWITVSYVHNKRLLYDAQKAAISVNNINPNTSAGEILNGLDKLNLQINKLGGFTLLWRGERNDMADAIADPYLNAELKYTTNIQVNVLVDKSYKPISGAVVYPENSTRRAVSTNKEGFANAEITKSRSEQNLTIELPKDVKLPNKSKTISFRIGESSSGKDVKVGIENGKPYINVLF
jgi:type VI protein secretion system component VasK